MQYVGLQGMLSASGTICSALSKFAPFWRENVARSKLSKRLSIARCVHSINLFDRCLTSYKIFHVNLADFDLLSTFIFYSQYLFATVISEVIWSLRKKYFPLDKKNIAGDDFLRNAE